MTDIAALIESGLALVPIPRGQKMPISPGWNRRESVITSPADARKLIGMNVGLAHAYSTPTPTCALDIDDGKAAIRWLDNEGIDLKALGARQATCRVVKQPAAAYRCFAAQPWAPPGVRGSG